MIFVHNLEPFVYKDLLTNGSISERVANVAKPEKVLDQLVNNDNALIAFHWGDNVIEALTYCQQHHIRHWPSGVRTTFLSQRRVATKYLDRVSQFGIQREYHSEPFTLQGHKVVKVGNDHGGRNKFLLPKGSNIGNSKLPCIVEDYLPGRSIRMLFIKDSCFIIEYVNSNNWIKNVNPEEEILITEKDPSLVPVELDAWMVYNSLYDYAGIDLVAIDYQVAYYTDPEEDHPRVMPLEINIMPGCPPCEVVETAYSKYFVELVKNLEKSSSQ